jgi:hypothetical protein
LSILLRLLAKSSETPLELPDAAYWDNASHAAAVGAGSIFCKVKEVVLHWDDRMVYHGTKPLI